jgi:hypothetical protein
MTMGLSFDREPVHEGHTPAAEALCEELIAPVEVLENAQGGVFRFKAVVSEADFLNGNRRIYPQDVLFPAFERLNEAIAGKTAQPGLVDHPEPFNPSSVSDIGIAWTGFSFEGKQVFGEGRIVPTAKGRDLQAAMEAGIPVGFSTRGFGTSEEIEVEGGKKARRMLELELETVDAVVNPSVRHARVQSYAKEEKDRMEQELLEAKAALEAAEAAKAAAEAKVAELEAQLAEAATRAEAAESRATELEGRVAELETLEAEAAALRAENELTAKLNELTEGHRFAATIIAEARELGVNIENAEKVVTRLKGLVEGVAASANETPGPRGVLSDEEERQDEGDQGDENAHELTEAEIEELRQAGLLH